MKLENIQEIVKQRLSEKTYYHSICVMEWCEELAIQFKIDIDTAKKIGIAHDIAKEISSEDKIRYIEERILHD